MDRSDLGEKLGQARQLSNRIADDPKAKKHAAEALRAGERVASRIREKRTKGAGPFGLLTDSELLDEAQHALSEIRSVRDRVTRRRRRWLRLAAFGGALGATAWILRDDERRRRAGEYVSRARAALSRNGEAGENAENGTVTSELESGASSGSETKKKSGSVSDSSSGLTTNQSG